MTQAAATMLAIVQDRFGGPAVLQPKAVPRPRAGPTEVLVRVGGAGLNPVEYAARAGRGIADVGDPPFILGWDLAGVIEEAGFGVTRFRPGDRVFGMPRFPKPASTYAQFATAPSRQLAATPAGLDDLEAAALPLAGLTAWQALVETAEVGPGTSVLIDGASGGVGHLAVQIAAARGARVFATARPERHGFVRELGADAVLAAREVEAGGLPGVDVAMGMIDSRERDARLYRLLSDSGVLLPIATAAGPADIQGTRRDGPAVKPVLAEPDRFGLEALAALVDDELLRPRVHAAIPLEQAAAGHRLGERGGIAGKLVLDARG